MKRTGQRGFTMLEMLVVVFIVLIMSAMAVPALFRSIRGYQLEGAARKVANVIVRARFEAVQRNQRICASFFRAPGVGGEARYGLDLIGPDPQPCDDGAVTALPDPGIPGEPFIVTPGNVQWFNADNPAVPPFAGLPPGFNNVPAGSVVVPANYRITFSPRGTVVVPAGGGNWVLSNQVQMIPLIQPVGSNFGNATAGYLITVTPVGKVRLYAWDPGGAQWLPR